MSTMLTWGAVIVVALAMVGISVRLHLVRRGRSSDLHVVTDALEKQTDAYDRLLKTTNELNEQLAQMMTETGIEPPSSLDDADPSPEEPNDAQPSRSHGGGSGTGLPPSGPMSAASGSVTSKSAESTGSPLWKRGIAAAGAVVRRRGRQWDQVNVADQVLPDVSGASVYDTVSAEFRSGLHSSAVQAVSRELSRKEEHSDQLTSATRIYRKSLRPSIVEPRALWQLESELSTVWNTEAP